MRDHGGNIDGAMARYGGAPEDWIDLSTGINRVPYPLPPTSRNAWTMLPTRSAVKDLCAAAARAYDTQAEILPLAGAQAAIQLMPRLKAQGTARIIVPTYNEHAASLRAAGWNVAEVADLSDLSGADLAVVVNPNNPDGRCYKPDALQTLAETVGMLVVDESFADPRPDLSLAPRAHTIDNLLVLRSFGKFYGLAGLRLGFALGPEHLIAQMAEMAGPWPISGAAIEIGRTALLDRTWAEDTTRRLNSEMARMDAIARNAGWDVLGGSELFRLYETPAAEAALETLAKAKIWSRIFPYSDRFIRLGMPGSDSEWARLDAALSDPEAR